MKDKLNKNQQRQSDTADAADNRKTKEPRLLKMVHHNQDAQQELSAVRNNKVTGHRRGYYSRNGYGSYDGL